MWSSNSLILRQSKSQQGRPARKHALCLILKQLEDRTMPSFLAPVGYAIGEPYGYQAVAVADFNRDGVPDLVAVATEVGSVSVALGNHDGTFQPANNFDVFGYNPTAAGVGDFNGDGKPDIVTTDNDGGAINVLLGNGDGTFQDPLDFYLPTVIMTSIPLTQFPLAVAVGDMSVDGKADLVVIAISDNESELTEHGPGPDFVNVLLGQGDGTFSA